MTLRDLRAAVAKLDGLHPLTPVNVGDLEAQIDQLEDENRKLRAVIGSNAGK